MDEADFIKVHIEPQLKLEAELGFMEWGTTPTKIITELYQEAAKRYRDLIAAEAISDNWHQNGCM